MLGIERVMDEVAHHLGLDPLQVRRLNFYPQKNATTFGITPYGQRVEDCVIPPIIDELVKTSNYEGRRAAIAEFNAANLYLKSSIKGFDTLSAVTCFQLSIHRVTKTLNGLCF